MRLHRFYTTEKIDTEHVFTIDSAELVHQVRRVFRLKKGDSIILFNGTHFDYICKIDDSDTGSIIVSDNSIRLRVTAMERSRSSTQQKLFLCAAITKKDTFEWIVEKATELGVTDIIPVMAERSEKKSLNAVRLNKIAIEASEQSGRDTIPMVHPIMGLLDVEDLLQQGPASPTSSNIQKIAFHTEGELLKREDLSSYTTQKADLACFIGPEGGWSPQEIEMFHTHNIPVKCLGSQILRTETAVVAALSLVVFAPK
ncbi:MAG: RsmE family RNA methyltransferase [Patescibacteria group bacterium]